jgi:hypothetical protein
MHTSAPPTEEDISSKEVNSSTHVAFVYKLVTQHQPAESTEEDWDQLCEFAFKWSIFILACPFESRSFGLADNANLIAGQDETGILT